MRLIDMKALRSVSRSVQVFNTGGNLTSTLEVRNGKIVNTRRLGYSSWKLVFNVVHNNSDYAMVFSCVYDDTDKSVHYVYLCSYSLRSGKEMRMLNAHDMVFELRDKGLIKLKNTSDIIANYGKYPYGASTTISYNDMKYFLVDNDKNGILVLSHEGKILFDAATMKEVKVGIKYMNINQNK